MKIAYVTTGFPHLSQTFIQREVHGLRALGVEVSTFTVEQATPANVLSARDAEDFSSTYAIRPVRLGDLLAAHAHAAFTRPRRWLRALAEAVGSAGPDPRKALWQVFYFVQGVLLWDQVQRRGARHIHAHFANVASDLALIASRVGGPGWTWSFTMHGPREFSDVSFFGLQRKAEQADFAVCISEFSRSQLMALTSESHWTNFEIVHCAVDDARFDPPARREHREGLRLLFVGRLAPVKGLPVLLQALQVLRGKGLDVTLTVVGEGPSRATLERMTAAATLEEYVTFVGAVGQDHIAGYFAQADALVLTSFAEGIPVVLMEAMAMRLPVVASRVAGVSELVEDGVSGFLVPPGSVAAVVDAVAAIAALDADAREALGSAGRARVLSQFETQITARKLKDVFIRRGIGA